MHALVLRIPFFAGFVHTESLQDELRSRGIPIIKDGVIAAHKRQMLAASRSGIYTILGPALSRINHFMNFMFFLAENPKKVYGVLGYLSIISAIMLFLGAALELPTWPFVAFFALEGIGIVLMAATVIALMVVQTKMTDIQWRAFRRASSFWMRLPVFAFDEAALAHTHGVPERLHDRMRRAAKIAGAQVEIDVFTEDPLVCVSRLRFHLFTERTYIGGWDTQNPQIENV